MPDFETLVVKIIGDSSGFERAMSRSSAAAATMGSKMRSVGRGMSTYVSLPLAAAGAASVKMASDFESSLQRAVSVTGLTGKAAAEARTQMNNLALELGRNTAFSAKDAADAMYDLASSGWDAHQMAKGLPGIMNLASATQSDLATATATVSSTLAQFGMKASDSGHVADVMTKSINATRLTMKDLQLGMKYVGPVADKLGLSLEETSAALGILADNGIRGEQAGTSLRGILGSLASPSTTAAGAIKNLGLNVNELNPATHSLSEIVSKLGKAGMTTADAYKIFGREGASAILALEKEGGPALDKLTHKLEKSGGTAEKTAKMQLKTLAGQAEMLKGSLETLAISIGQVLIPPLLWMVKRLDSVLGVFLKLPGPVRNTGVALGVVAAAAGPVIWAAGAIIGAWKNVAPVVAGAARAAGRAIVWLGNTSVVMAAKQKIAAASMYLFSKAAKVAALAGRALRLVMLTMLGPWGLVIAAIVAGAYLIYKHWDKIKAAAKQLGQALKAAWNATKNAVVGAAKSLAEGAVSKFREMDKNARKSSEELRRGVSNKFKDLVNGGRRLFDDLKQGVVNKFQEMDSNSRKASESMRKGVGERIESMRKGVTKTVDSMKTKAGGLISDMRDNAQNRFEELKRGVSDRAETARKNVVSAIDMMKRNGGDLISAMRDNAHNRFEEIKKGVSDRAETMRKNVMGALEKLRAGAADLWDRMKGGATSFGDGFKKILGDAFGSAVNKMRDWLGYAAGGLASLLDLIGVGPVDALKSKASDLHSPIQFARGGIYNADAGGIAGPGRMGLVGEAGQKEAVVNLERYTPESARAFEAAQRSPAARRHRARGSNSSMEDVQRLQRGYDASGATSHNWVPWVADHAREVERKFAPNVSVNTYARHGTGDYWGEQHSVDHWGPGGRGSHIKSSVGDQVVDYITSNWGKDIRYYIWKGMIHGWGKSRPYSDKSDQHYDHVHATYDEGGSGGLGSGGGSSVFDIAGHWASYVKKLGDFPSGGVLDNFDGTGLKVLGWIKDWVWEKAKSMVGLGGGGMDNFSGSGMELMEKSLAKYNLPKDWLKNRDLWNIAKLESGTTPSNVKFQPNGPRFMAPWGISNPNWAGVSPSDPSFERFALGPRYVKRQYGTPANAMAFHKRHNWYDKGGIIPGIEGQKRLVVAHAGERILPLDTVRAFDNLAHSVNIWHKSGGKISRPGREIRNDLMHGELKEIKHTLNRQLDRMHTLEEIVDANVRGNVAFKWSDGEGKIEEIKQTRRMRRLRELSGV